MIPTENLKDLAFRSFRIAEKGIQPGLSSCHFRLCGPRCNGPIADAADCRRSVR